MFSFSTEVTSSSIRSDNALYKRTLKAYHLISKKTHGDVLEIGCGEGYGLDIIIKNTKSLTVIDKSKYTLNKIKKRYKKVTIINQRIPPLKNLKDNSFDVVVSFQVIEHIKDATLFINEIHRVLKPNGTAYITTPNSKKSIARNPWHYKEYNYSEIKSLIEQKFINYCIKGIKGNKKTDSYYSKNKRSVERLLQLDVFKIQHIIPAFLLKLPYEIVNRFNRARLFKKNNALVNSITLEDYSLDDYSTDTLDFFCTMNKKDIL
ncbi:class I SAM-dependent methyltransferase [Aurantibacter sp.]|jgi:2-polyprenyl-3-methyl-5-hydroxy-6-metoxy-1,4-benzoquinol methylase|uniref:class I SAM-dependent methyltransferase n=1 Tax=Aurantibacter sp. TaxID=2807103 RepID=UPI0035C81E99